MEEGEEDDPPGLHVLHVGNLGALAQDQAKSHTVEEATPMYRKTPKRTRTGMSLRTGARTMETSEAVVSPKILRVAPGLQQVDSCKIPLIVLV